MPSPPAGASPGKPRHQGFRSARQNGVRPLVKGLDGPPGEGGGRRYQTAGCRAAGFRVPDSRAPLRDERAANGPRTRGQPGRGGSRLVDGTPSSMGTSGPAWAVGSSWASRGQPGARGPGAPAGQRPPSDWPGQLAQVLSRRGPWRESRSQGQISRRGDTEQAGRRIRGSSGRCSRPGFQPRVQPDRESRPEALAVVEDEHLIGGISVPQGIRASQLRLRARTDRTHGGPARECRGKGRREGLPVIEGRVDRAPAPDGGRPRDISVGAKPAGQAGHG